MIGFLVKKGDEGKIYRSTWWCDQITPRPMRRNIL